MSKLHVKRVGELSQGEQQTKWLIEGLWLDGGVGIIGGEPKSFKTFAGLSLAVSVASGRECFGHYPVKRLGPVLLFAAEDSVSMVQKRIEGICSRMNLDLALLDIHVICEARLQIDTKLDQERIEKAVQEIGPALFILDPFVRLHSIDENSAIEVARVLSWLRHLQRTYGTSISLVHHARKRAGRERPGQSLRGTSELHAWGDSNLYFRRLPGNDNLVDLTIEHRSAPSDQDIILKLETNGPSLEYQAGGLPVLQNEKSRSERICEALKGVSFISGEALRKRCAIKAELFWKELKILTGAGTVLKTANGYTLANGD